MLAPGVVICCTVSGGAAMCDMRNLSRLKTIEANAPEAMRAFLAFDAAPSPTEPFR